MNEQLDSQLASKTNEDGVRDFINDVEDEITYLDKAGLEDWISFHEAEFEITDCYFSMKVGITKSIM